MIPWWKLSTVQLLIGTLHQKQVASSTAKNHIHRTKCLAMFSYWPSRCQAWRSLCAYRYNLISSTSLLCRTQPLSSSSDGETKTLLVNGGSETKVRWGQLQHLAFSTWLPCFSLYLLQTQQCSSVWRVPKEYKELSILWTNFKLCFDRKRNVTKLK